jgi:lysophospholipase L1-like esterase
MIFSVLAAELLLRFSLGLASPPLLTADQEVGYLFQANQDLYRFGSRVHINSYHQRSEDISAEPDTSSFRVLFLGDSVTWGGVLIDQKNTYPEVFEDQAEKGCAKPVESLNASAGSWGVGNLRAYLEQFGTFESELVVFQVGSQDLLQGKSDSSPVGVHPSMPTERPMSAIQELVDRYLWPRYMKPLVSNVSFFSRVSASPMSGSLRRGSQFVENMQDLEWMIREVRRAGSRPIILHTPERWEVSKKRKSKRPKYERYRGDFLKKIDSLGVPILNLKREWGKKDGMSSYYRDYIHMNKKGYKKIGKKMWKFVGKRDLIGACRPV